MGIRWPNDFRLADFRPRVGLVAGRNFQMAFRRAHLHFRLGLPLEKSRAVPRRHVNAFLLWLAQGFGICRIPKAPGTFGTVVGFGWFALLVLTGNLTLYLIGTIIGLALSVWLCGAGEKILKKRDPGSVVFDEITAIPVCFIGWVIVYVKN